MLAPFVEGETNCGRRAADADAPLAAGGIRIEIVVRPCAELPVACSGCAPEVAPPPAHALKQMLMQHNAANVVRRRKTTKPLEPGRTGETEPSRSSRRFACRHMDALPIRSFVVIAERTTL